MKKITFKNGNTIIVSDKVVKELSVTMSKDTRDSMATYQWFINCDGEGTTTLINYPQVESIVDVKGFKEKYIAIGMFFACAIIVAVGILAELFK